MTSYKHNCPGCGCVDDGPFANCKCNQEDDMRRMPEETTNNDAGQSEPVNDPGGFEQPTEDTADSGVGAMPNPAEEVALGIHVMMMGNGNFGMQVTGEANLGEMIMLLSRAVASVQARLTVETLMAAQQEAADASRIITPGRK